MDKYELVIYGLKDPSREGIIEAIVSLVKLLEIDENTAADVLAEFPVQVLTGKTEKELLPYLDKLNQAGCDAKVEALLPVTKGPGNVFVIDDDGADSTVSPVEEPSGSDTDVDSLVQELLTKETLSKPVETRAENLLEIKKLATDASASQTIARPTEPSKPSSAAIKPTKATSSAQNKPMLSSAVKRKVLIVKKNRKKAIRKLIQNMLLGVVFALAVFILCINLLNDDEIEARKKELQASVENVITQIKDINKPIDTKSQTTIDEVFEAAINDPNYSLKAKYVFIDQQFADINVELTTPPPPDLTDIDLVKKVSPDPWIKKIIIDNLKIDKKETGNYIAVGTAKAFIELGAERYRLAGDAVISGLVDFKNQKITGKLLINKGFKTLPEDTNFEIANIQGKLFDLFIKSEFELTPASIKKESDVQQ